jgi:PAS domain S-box-containing protein
MLGGLAVGLPLGGAVGMACGQSLALELAARVLRRIGLHGTLARLSDMLALLVTAVPCALLAATSGILAEVVLGHALAGAAPAAAAKLPTWWLGDLAGLLVVGPFLLVVGGRGAGPAAAAASSRRWAPPPLHAPFRSRITEGVIAWAALLGMAGFVFTQADAQSPLRQPSFLFPPLLWLALRFGPRASSGAMLLVTALAVGARQAGGGPFASDLGLQLFVALTAATLLLVSAAAAQQARAGEAARASNAMMRAMLEGTSAPVYAKDPQGRYVFINRAAVRVFGRSEADILGKDDLDLGRTPRRTAEFACGEHPGEAAEESITLEGEAHTLLWNRGPFVDDGGEVLGTVGVARDITERKRAEQALEAAVRARDEFLYIAGHELRTPLCTVVLELGSLERACRKARVDERIVGRVIKILSQTDRLTQLMHRLLEVSRLSSTSLDLHCERVDLAALAGDVLERFSESALRAGSTLELHAAGTATGTWDKLRLEQLLTNLVGNAIKYGAGRPIVISVESTATGASLSVRDGGIGVAREDVERIFEAFERGVSVDHFAGFGLGLYISRRIVEAHGGRIHVDSTPGQGATFVVELPPVAATASVGPLTPTRAPELRVGAR